MEKCCKTCKYWTYLYSGTEGECDQIGTTAEDNLHGELAGISVTDYADLHGITIYFRTDEDFLCSLHEDK